MAARRRLKWLDYYRVCGGNTRLTYRRADLLSLVARCSPGDLTTLESSSRRPRRLRQPS